MGCGRRASPATPKNDPGLTNLDEANRSLRVVDGGFNFPAKGSRHENAIPRPSLPYIVAFGSRRSRARGRPRTHLLVGRHRLEPNAAVLRAGICAGYRSGAGVLRVKT